MRAAGATRNAHRKTVSANRFGRTAAERAHRMTSQCHEHDSPCDKLRAGSARFTSIEASLACDPTAEAHTFLGWTYSSQGRLDLAIEECKKAIAVDPEFGNPYNDIGSYLIHLGKLDAAIPWLERAITAQRYEPRHYPHCNLGRVYRAKGMLQKAIEEFEKALKIAPDYPVALKELAEVRAQLN